MLSHYLDKKLFLSIFMAVSVLFTSGQNTPEGKMLKGWIIGMHTGLYIANNYTANYYSGREGNENEISFILDNKFHRDEILKYYEATNYTYSQSDLPHQMRYSPDINIGFLARNNITEDWGVFINFTFTRLRAQGVFVLEMDPSHVIEERRERVFDIYGVEERNLIDIGVHRQFDLISPGITYYAEAGININNLKVKESTIRIADRGYSIINRYGGDRGYDPNIQQTEYDIRLGGFGTGVFSGMGLKFFFNEELTLDLGTTIYLKFLNLKHYKSFTLHTVPYVRIMYNGFFDFI